MPRDRRRLMDLEIGKVSKEYLNALSRYNLLLKDKNKLLKEEKMIKQKQIKEINQKIHNY